MGSELLPFEPTQMASSAEASARAVAGGLGVRGGRGRLPSLLAAVPASKRSKVLKDLRKREADFSTVKGVGIFCGTWNVNAKKPDCPDCWWLHEWLCPRDEGDGGAARREEDSPDKKKAALQHDAKTCSSKTEDSSKEDGMADVYAIGLQEVVDLNAVNVAIDIRSQASHPHRRKRSVEWEERVLFTLNMAALHPTARRANASSFPPTTTPPNVATAEVGNNNNINKSVRGEQNQTAETTTTTTTTGTDTASNALRDNKDADDGGGTVSFGVVDGDFHKPHAVQGKTSTSASAIAAAAAAATDIETGSTTPRDGPTPSGRTTSKGYEGGAPPPQATFVLVAKEHLVGTWLAVFVRASMLTQVSDVRSGIVTAGVMGVMGNKGGVGIRLRLCNSSLCFVTSHLAAHRDNVRARNDNYLKILREMNFPPLAPGQWRTNQQQQSRRYQNRGSPPPSPGTTTAGRPPNSASSRQQSPGSPRSRGRMFATPPPGVSPLRPTSPPRATSKSARLTVRSLSPPSSSGGYPSEGFEGEGWPGEGRGGQGQGLQHRMGRLGRGRSPQGDGRRRRSRSGSMLASFSPLFSALSSPTAQDGECGSSSSKCSVAAKKENPPPLPPRPAAMSTTTSTSATVGEGSVADVTTRATAEVENAPLTENISPSSPADKKSPPNFPSRPDTDSGTGSGTGAGTGAGINAGTDAGTDTGTDAGTGAGTSAGIDAGTKPLLVEVTPGRNVPGDADAEKPALKRGDDHHERLMLAGDSVSGAREAGGGAGSEEGGRSSDRVQEGLEEGGGEGERERPTQVLRVPEMATRDPDEELGIQDHDAVFWFGDLNYRIDSSVSALDVLEHALSRRLLFLAENDQLNSAREAGDAFEGFQE
ncbi:unnamed protein product, partial [Laminaria digitata]